MYAINTSISGVSELLYDSLPKANASLLITMFDSIDMKTSKFTQAMDTVSTSSVANLITSMACTAVSTTCSIDYYA
jgi:hypothetical protein